MYVSLLHTFLRKNCNYPHEQQKGRNIPCTGLDKPCSFQEFEAPIISRLLAHDGGKVVSPTHQSLLPPLQRLNRFQGHDMAGRILSIKDSNETIGNRTRYLPGC